MALHTLDVASNGKVLVDGVEIAGNEIRYYSSDAFESLALEDEAGTELFPVTGFADIDNGITGLPFVDAAELFDFIQTYFKAPPVVEPAPFALTTTGSSGPATFDGETLNVPEYTAGEGGDPGSYSFTAPLSETGGTVSVVPATTLVPGSMSAADKLKLDNIAPSATANDTDANLKNRANHTGTQAAGTITGLATVATSGNYSDLSGAPSLATVATSGNYSDLSGLPTLGTSAVLNVPAVGDAAVGEVVKGNDSRLTNSRTPTTHNHTVSQITDFPSLGTAAAANVPASGDAAAGEVVKGNDSRLTNTRTASGLASATTTVSVATATAPTAGQVLTATSSTAANWQTPTGGGSSPDIQTFTGNGTWNKPAGAKLIEVTLVGGGGGGASGRKGLINTNRGGGGGGGGGGLTRVTFLEADVASSVAITIGTAGTGGAAQTTSSTNGNAGSVGGNTSFGTVIFANGGNGGTGGTTAGGAAGAGGAGWGSQATTSGIGFAGGAGGTTNGNNAANPGYPGICGGGGGAGLNSANTFGTGGRTFQSAANQIMGGSCNNGGNADSAGSAGCATPFFPFSFGGGGAGSSSAGTVGYAGGNATGYGAGGGGGSAATDGAGNSGAGGNGAPGIAIIITYF